MQAQLSVHLPGPHKRWLPGLPVPDAGIARKVHSYNTTRHEALC